LNDISGEQSNVLCPGTMIVINILLNLRFPLSNSRLIDRHFNVLIKISYYDRA
jgi:hypothetical protein